MTKSNVHCFHIYIYFYTRLSLYTHVIMDISTYIALYSTFATLNHLIRLVHLFPLSSIHDTPVWQLLRIFPPFTLWPSHSPDLGWPDTTSLLQQQRANVGLEPAAAVRRAIALPVLARRAVPVRMAAVSRVWCLEEKKKYYFLCCVCVNGYILFFFF